MASGRDKAHGAFKASAFQILASHFSFKNKTGYYMTTRRLTFLLFLLLAGFINAAAQVLLYYGGGNIDNGYGTNGQILTSYVLFPSAYVKPYAGNQITKVRIGMKGAAKNVTLYIKENQRDSKPLYTQSVGTLSEGWNEVVLDKPFGITGKKNIAVGFKATLQADAALGYAKEKVSDGDFIFVNQTSKWTSTGGTLCLQTMVEGDQMPQNELAIGKLADQTAPYDAQTMTFTTTVRNMGANAVASYTLKCTIDDTDEQTLQMDHGLDLNATDTVAVSVPSTVVGTHTVKLWIDQVNDAADSNPQNNTAEARLIVKDPRFARRVVCEENTGLWCGWCPRGMVGLELMKERHPGTFIAVSVHGGDELEVNRDADYNYAPFTDSQKGAPSCMVNRKLSGDPYFDIENLYRMETMAENHLAYTMEARWNSDSTAIETTSHFFSDVDIADAQYNVAFIVTEDSVTGYAQTNYYQQTPDQEFYGWEKKEVHTTDCYFNDLARGIFPSYSGTPCSPASMTAETVYDYSYDVPLPPTVTDRLQVNVIGVLIDHRTGYIVNGFCLKPAISQWEELGICPAAPEGQTPVHSLCDLQGRTVDKARRGLLIERTTGADGHIVTRKIFVR